MSDAANATTRNIMPKRAGTPGPMDYRSGSGMTYAEQLRRASWPTVCDVPKIGQKSASMQLPELREFKGFRDSEHYLHPTKFTAIAHSDHLSYAKCNDELDVLWNGDPAVKNAHERLYLGSKVLQRAPRRSAQSLFEMAADVAFQCVEAEDAVPLYTKAIQQQSASNKVTNESLFAYEKRCAANAELGRYREALADAEHILKWTTEKGSALARVKAIKGFMRRMENYEPGYHHATTTLICLLRPREHRQLTQSRPSTYGGPMEKASRFGRGMTSSTSMGQILGWDTNNDGRIDMDEFRERTTTLGYTPKRKEKSAFGYQESGDIWHARSRLERCESNDGASASESGNPPCTAIHLQALRMHTALRCPGTHIYTCRWMIYMHARVRSTAARGAVCTLRCEI